MRTVMQAAGQRERETAQGSKPAWSREHIERRTELKPRNEDGYAQLQETNTIPYMYIYKVASF